MKLVPCSSCRRLIGEAKCPFCGGARNESRGRVAVPPPRIAAAALMLGAMGGLAACSAYGCPGCSYPSDDASDDRHIGADASVVDAAPDVIDAAIDVFEASTASDAKADVADAGKD